MSGELTAKLRLVICPKCRLLLPELPQFDVYKCGKCGTTLQAKKRDSAPRNALNLVSEDQERSNGKQPVLPQENVLRTKATSSSSGECSFDLNGGRGRNENGECDEKQLVLTQDNVLRTKSASPVECSLVVNDGGVQNENGECNGKKLVLTRENVLRTKSAGSSSRECSLDNGGRVQNENGEGSGKKLVLPRGGFLRTKATSFSLGDCSFYENGRRGENKNEECNGEQLALPQENVRRTKATSSSSGECSFNEDGGRDQNENGEFNAGPLGPSNLSDKDPANEMDPNKGCSTELTQCEIEASSVLMGKSSVEEITDNYLQSAGEEELDNGSLLLEGAEEQLICASDGVDANRDKSALTGAKSEGDVAGSDATAKSLTTDNFAAENGSSSLVTPCKPEEGSISGNPVSSSDKEMKQARESIHHNLDRLRSVESFDTTEVINTSSELSGALGKLSKSPTTRSSRAYDGSVSSYDGMDKQFPNQHLNPFENTNNEANVVSEGRARKGKGPINSMNFSSDLPSGKHRVMKGKKGNQYKVQETTRRDRPVRRWMRTEMEEYPSRMPSHRSGSHSGYENDSPLNQMHDELYCSSSFLSLDSREDSDQEKMKLLRMIYKLQDQLNRTSSLNGETNGRLSKGVSYKGKNISAFQSHDLHEGRFSHGLDDPWCNGRCSHGINWRQSRKFSRIPFSAEATSSTHHVDNSCFHCCPQERRCSAELPPHVLYQYEELCRFHPNYNRCFSHRSYPSSSTGFMSSKLPLYGRETKSDNQRHRAYGMRIHFREKQNLAKRHFRPVASGAPFVTCCNCFKLLQLPADFLLFKRVCHQLKCGACSEILKFSLQNRSHIVSYAPNAIGPPSSELNDQSEVINGSNMPSASRANYFNSSHADPISYSDDSGLSVCKSSSEGDPVSLTSFHPLHGSEYDPNVCRGNFEEEEKIASRHSSTSKTPVETYKSAGVSSNMSGSEKLSSEMEAPPPPRSSPLHQLMGYSSPSQVIRGVQLYGEGNELMHNEHDLSGADVI